MEQTEMITLKQKALIEFDFEQIKKHLESQLSMYQNLIFTEGTKKDAKNTIANLRKEKSYFQSRVKEIKAEYMKPFDEFFEKANEISDMYDQPIAFIDEQIEAFESKRIALKKVRIFEIYEEIIEPEYQDILPYDRIYNKRWENATFKESQIRAELTDIKIDAKNAITTIKLMNSEKEQEALEMYRNGADLASCMTYISNYEHQKREILERESEKQRRIEEELIRTEERAKIEVEQALKQAHEDGYKSAIDNLIPEDETGADEAIYTYDITLTANQKDVLEMYMNSVGIVFELCDLPM